MTTETTVYDRRGTAVAELSVEASYRSNGDLRNERGWLILSTNMDNEHRRTDVFPYRKHLWEALTALLSQLQEALLD